MHKEILINTDLSEKRVAIVTDGLLEEFYIERPEDKTIVGNIYKGRIEAVVPSLNAAFVDIGQSKKGFLYLSEIEYSTYEPTEEVKPAVPLKLKKGDEVLVSAYSRELGRNYGWKAPAGNIPAAYLTGVLCGLRAKAEGLEEAILDIGLYPPTKGARMFAVLKGVLDAELEVAHSEEKLPEDNRITGEHIAKYAKSLATNAEDYQARFSKYLEQKLSPEKLPDHVKQVKANIKAAFKTGGRKK